jgi:hypothetical protein
MKINVTSHEEIANALTAAQGQLTKSGHYTIVYDPISSGLKPFKTYYKGKFYSCFETLFQAKEYCNLFIGWTEWK